MTSKRTAKLVKSARGQTVDVESIVRNMWNHMADGYNQWDSLGQDEIDTLIAVATAEQPDNAGVRK